MRPFPSFPSQAILSRLPGFAAAALAFALLLPASGHARLGGNMGVGFVAGKPSGLSSKIWLNDNNALDLTLGYNVFDNWLGLNADYLWHEFDLFRVPKGQLPLFYGMGLWAAVANHGAIGVRGVVGIEYLFPSAPFDAFFELAPGISVLPSTDLNFDAGLGMRYFF